MTKKILTVLLLLLQVSSISAKDLGNAELIEMLGAKVPERTIINIIESATIKVDTSGDAIARLKSAGASDTLLEVILKAAFKPQAALSQPTADSKKADLLTEGRILLVQNGKNTDLVAENFTTRKGFAALFQPSNYVDFRPFKTSFRVDNATPEFEQSLEAQYPPQGWSFLIKFEKSVGDTRVATLLYDQGGGISLEKDAVIPLEFEQIQEVGRADSTRKSWRYKPKQPLQPGEYAIYYKRRFYTFGLDGASKN